jgi:hypothetical protein
MNSRESFKDLENEFVQSELKKKIGDMTHLSIVAQNVLLLTVRKE